MSDQEETTLDALMASPHLDAALRLGTLAKAAERESTPDQLAVARDVLRGFMEQRGLTNHLDALVPLLQSTVDERERRRLCFAVWEAAGGGLPGAVAGIGNAGTAGLPHEVANETHRRNLCDIAERECTAEQLTAARQQHRAWMLEHAQGDPLQAAALRLGEMNGATVKQRALVVHAAAAVLDEGRQGREDVPTADGLGGDPGEGKKGRKGKRKAQGPKKSKRSTAWLRHLGATVARYRASAVLDDARLLELLREGAFRRRPEEIMALPEYGFCPITDPSIGTAEMSALPAIGADPEWVVWGWRRDAKTGCPTHRFRFEAEREATTEALAEGKANASGARIKELMEERVTGWYRTATPQTTVWPVTYHRPTHTFHVHGASGKDLEACVGRIQATIGSLVHVPTVVEAAPSDGLARTDVRSQDVAGDGAANLGVDLLLWLVGRQLGGTGVMTLADGRRLEWWLDDAVELARSTSDDKKLRVKLAGAPAEGGSLAAALADGATIQGARITLKLDEDKWSVNVTSGAGRAWKLPTLTKPDGTPAGLDAAVDERLRLWMRGRALLDGLMEAYLVERVDRGTWRQRVSALRAQLGLEMVKRWAFDPKTGVGFLFSHMLPGEQGTLAGVQVQDERPTPPPAPRGRKGRSAAAAETEA